MIEKSDLEIGKVIIIGTGLDHPGYRKLRVETGWLYNFWNLNLHDYNQEWIFVPNKDLK